MRIDRNRPAGDAAAMDTDTKHTLMDEAEELALRAFGPAAEVEHIEAVFERLAWCWLRGLPADGAATVH
ncbi:hypothetical protein [Castellaniella ginsengisoli]|uniref:Uncharacterized protein n=1 Tax=Castellaniella ginsengisoli TaxID=546114 RepID=A0AB39DP90_9BURK